MNKGLHLFIFIVLSCAALFALGLGIYALESPEFSDSTGYLTILLAGGAIWALSYSRAKEVQPGNYWQLLPAAVLTIVAVLCLYTLGTIDSNRFFRFQIAIWIISITSISAAAFCFDKSQALASDGLRIFERPTLVAGLIIFIVALVARTIGPSTAAGDEALHFGQMLQLGSIPASPWDHAEGYPYILYWLIYILSELIGNGIESFDLFKFIPLIAASISVSAWYFLVLSRSSRSIALYSALILAFMGWHWVNSRFAYVYPYDLAITSFGLLCFSLAFSRKALGWAVLSGIFCAFAFIDRKNAVCILPITFVLFADYFVTAAKGTRLSVLKIALGVMLGFCVCYAPYIRGHLKDVITDSDSFARINLALSQKQARLSNTGESVFGNSWYVFKDAFRQFQVESYDTFRHYFRPQKPLLDPILSGMATVGFITALFTMMKSQTSRFIISGLVLSTLPMVISYPLDSTDPHGLSRRMIGCSFFIAWLGAIGIDRVAALFSSVRSKQLVGAFICAAIVIVNIYFFYGIFLKPDPLRLFSDHGIYRHALIRSVRSAANNGERVVALTHDWCTFEGADKDLRDTYIEDSFDAFRKRLTELTPGTYRVIIPAFWFNRGAWTYGTISKLADLIPPYSWMPGPLDPLGSPMLQSTLITIPKP